MQFSRGIRFRRGLGQDEYPKGMPVPVVQKLAAAQQGLSDPAFERLMRDISAPIDIVNGKAYEAEVAESYKVAEKILPPLVKEGAK